MPAHRMLIDLPRQLETERLIVRPYQRGDGPRLYAASQRNRDHLARYESENVLMELTSEEEAEIAAREMAAGWASRSYFFLGAWEKATGEFAAQVYVGVVDWNVPEFEIGYIADVDHEGRGFASEAVRAVLGMIFGALGAQRVSLRCDETNARSIRLAERCGFTREGLLREIRLNPDGTRSSTLIYGLLRREFEAG